MSTISRHPVFLSTGGKTLKLRHAYHVSSRPDIGTQLISTLDPADALEAQEAADLAAAIYKPWIPRSLGTRNPGLVIIDPQNKWASPHYEGNRKTEAAMNHILNLQAAFHRCGRPVIIVHTNSLPDNIHSFQTGLYRIEPGHDHLLKKKHDSAITNPRFPGLLRDLKIDTPFFAGFNFSFCYSSSIVATACLWERFQPVAILDAAANANNLREHDVSENLQELAYEDVAAASTDDVLAGLEALPACA